MFSLGYIIDSQICVTVLYLFYLAFLHRRVTHSAARAYLLCMLPVALILPLLEIPLLPATIIEQSSQQVLTATTPTTTQPLEQPTSPLMWIYLSGIALMSLSLAVGVVRLAITILKNSTQTINSLHIVFADQRPAAYSVFNRIFIKESYRSSESLDTLLVHEECHIRHRHTLDLIYISVAKIAFWFNPAIWHTAHLLRQVHEYQVDQEVINKGYSTQNYINLLILSEAGISPEFASSLSYSLTKKRLTMLAKKHRASSRLRLLLTLPLIAILMMAFSLTTRAEVVPSVQLRDYLVLVNGVEYTGDIDNIPIDSIRSMNVIKAKEDLKKFSSYGEKAKNGVIEIILKDGSEPDKANQAETATPNTIPKTEDNGEVTFSKYSPLIIVDGVKMTDMGVLNAIKPESIQQLSVLKEPMAIAEYGDDGKNGVILITLKDKAQTKSDGALPITTQETVKH